MKLTTRCESRADCAMKCTWGCSAASQALMVSANRWKSSSQDALLNVLNRCMAVLPPMVDTCSACNGGHMATDRTGIAALMIPQGTALPGASTEAAPGDARGGRLPDALMATWNPLRFQGARDQDIPPG